MGVVGDVVIGWEFCELMFVVDVGCMILCIVYQIIEKIVLDDLVGFDVLWVVLLGILICGVMLVNCLVGNIIEYSGIYVGYGVLDIILYCDDLMIKLLWFLVLMLILVGGIDDVLVILVDDVFYFGCLVCFVLDVLCDVGWLWVV